MKPYKDLDNNSQIEQYRHDKDSITIRFKDGTERDCTMEKVGTFQIKKLKHLADSGRGLDAYIEELDSETA